MKSLLSCDFCHAKVEEISYDKFTLVNCKKCNTDKFLFNGAYDYGYDSKYTSDNYLNNYELRWAHRVIQNQLINLGLNDTLEIGCFNGFFVKRLRGLGVNCFGLDINKNAISWGIKNLPLSSNIIKFDKFDQNFETIILIDVLEHIDNPSRFLLDLIESYGVQRFIISCPNSKRVFKDKSDWPPHHYWRFSRESFLKILEPMGYNESLVFYESSVLLLIRNFLGRLKYGFEKRWFTGAPVYSVGRDLRKIYQITDNILSTPFKAMGFKYASILVVYELNKK